MVHLNEFFVVVAGLHSLVSNVVSAKATRTVLHIKNVTSLVYGEHVSLLCDVSSTDKRMISGVSLSRTIKTETETIAVWSNTWAHFIPKGRKWTVTIDNNTGEIQLEIEDFSNLDSGIYYCIQTYYDYTQNNWLNLTRSDQFESEEKTDDDEILQSVTSKIALCFSIVGMLAIVTGLLVAFWKRKFCLSKLNCGRNLSSNEELQHIEGVTFVHNVISEIIHVVELTGLDIEGIYRLSCPQWELTKARQDIKQDTNAINGLPVITLCNLLKVLIRELATPLIPEDVAKELLMANAFTTESEKFNRMKFVLQQLDITHFDCLSDIILHMRRVAEHAEINKMTAENLAVVFAPSLLLTASSYNHLETIDAVKKATEENECKCQVIAFLIKNL